MTDKLRKDLAEVVPGELDNTSPEIIWLQIDTSASNKDRDELWPGDDGVTWCSESIGGLEIQYVRADIYREAAKRLAALEQAVDWIGQTNGNDVDKIRKRADEIMRERSTLEEFVP